MGQLPFAAQCAKIMQASESAIFFSANTYVQTKQKKHFKVSFFFVFARRKYVTHIGDSTDHIWLSRFFFLHFMLGNVEKMTSIISRMFWAKNSQVKCLDL